MQEDLGACSKNHTRACMHTHSELLTYQNIISLRLRVRLQSAGARTL